jgi:hypothetical protein
MEQLINDRKYLMAHVITGMAVTRQQQLCHVRNTSVRSCCAMVPAAPWLHRDGAAETGWLLQP